MRFGVPITLHLLQSKKCNLYHTRGITPKSGGAHLRGLMRGQQLPRNVAAVATLRLQR